MTRKRTIPNRCDSPGCHNKRAVGKYCRPCARVRGMVVRKGQTSKPTDGGPMLRFHPNAFQLEWPAIQMDPDIVWHHFRRAPDLEKLNERVFRVETHDPVPLTVLSAEVKFE